MNHQDAKIPIDHLATYVKDCINVADHIVSVGCGSGIYESEICRIVEGFKDKLILVDPDPTSFSKEIVPGMKPHYKHVLDLIKSNPKVVSNCVLLLIWPYAQHYVLPSPYVNSSGETVDLRIDYDIEAVNLLKPCSIICLYEKPDSMPNGASASDGMVKLLYNPERYDYKLMCNTKYGFNGHMGGMYPQIRWIAKRGSRVPKEKTCLLLQDEADKVSTVDINNEQVCTIS